MYNLYKITRRQFLLLLIMMFLIGFAQAQESVLTEIVPGSGKVVDSYGNPIANVLVQVKGREAHALTNVLGYYNLELVPGQVLVFSHPDYYNRERKLKSSDTGGTPVEVSLAAKYLPDPQKLDVLYGSTDKENYIGAASTIYTDQMASSLSNTLISSFSGRLAGLYVQQTRGFRNPSTTANSTADLIGSVPVFGAGMPTDNSQFGINARGLAPVVIVDGIQRELFSLDPENIESVSIQNDALSSIFLGMRSSRAVLLVTTKKPSKGAFQLSFTGRYGVQSTLKMPEQLPAYQYAYLLNEALQNDGKTPAYTYEDFQAYKNGSDPFGHPDIDWYNKSLKKNAPVESYNLNVSGGSATARYFVSLGYFNQEGLFRSSDMNSYETNLRTERYLINSKLEIDITDELKVGATIIGRIEEGNQPGDGYNNILNAIYTTPNNAYPVYNMDGSWGGNISYYNNILSRTFNSGYVSDETRDAVANIDLTYDLKRLVKGLTFKAITNISTQNTGAISRKKQSLVYQYTPGENGEEGRYDPFGVLSPQSNQFISVSNARYWYGQLGFDYQTTIGKHKIDATVHADKNVVTLNYDLPQKPANMAIRGRYNYGGKYFAELAATRSYFNRYMPDKRWGTFYAFGIGWDISKENFLKDTDWLDRFKLTGVYGETGNGIDNSGYYIWRQTFRTSVTDYVYLQGNNYGFGEGIVATGLANTNITWEKAHKINVGADVALFNNHLNITGNYYHDNYYDLLQSRGRSIALMGLDYPAENIGKKLFYGGEISLTYQNNWGDFNYFVTANWNQGGSKVKFIDEQYKPEEYNKVTGKPNGAAFGLVADGFFNSVEEIANSPVIEGFNIQPGDIKYKDLNNDGVINIFDFKMIGGGKPLTYYGITTGFNYKGFDFNVLFQGVYNRDIYMGDNVLMAGFQGVGQSYGQAYLQMTDRWTPETKETATYPRLTAGGNSYNMNPNGWWTSFWMRSGNYFRIKDINLAYTLPDAVCHRFFGGTRIKLFVSGQNVFTKADFTLDDPEVRFTNYPLQRVISTGVNIKF
ncbi:SusC/RagA family TonB-linked outer membrane protein [Gaoshiqia sp. Z1-71]|uniref:SusC/RagA family TonB-linked outer membrane protein n=1 Tax=Gaoshiqia hydrogeniformans TaxID=3290090 RepID=UPI003BF8EA64